MGGEKEIRRKRKGIEVNKNENKRYLKRKPTRTDPKPFENLVGPFGPEGYRRETRGFPRNRPRDEMGGPHFDATPPCSFADEK